MLDVFSDASGGLKNRITKLDSSFSRCSVFQVYLAAVFPANVYAALNEVPLRGEAPAPLWVRTLMQLLYIGMVWWTSIKEPASTQGVWEEPATAQRGEEEQTTN